MKNSNKMSLLKLALFSFPVWIAFCARTHQAFTESGSLWKMLWNGEVRNLYSIHLTLTNTHEELPQARLSPWTRPARLWFPEASAWSKRHACWLLARCQARQWASEEKERWVLLKSWGKWKTQKVKCRTNSKINAAPWPGVWEVGKRGWSGNREGLDCQVGSLGFLHWWWRMLFEAEM